MLNIHSQQQTLSKEALEAYFNARKSALLALEHQLGKKLMQMIADKIASEETASFKLLHDQDASAATREQYSFVLNPNFFEQQFL